MPYICPLFSLNTVIMECGMLRGRIHNKWPTPNHNVLKSSNLLMEQKGRDHLEPSSRPGKLSGVFVASSLSEDQLRSLDSYFRKLLKDDLQSSSRSFNRRAILLKPRVQLKAKAELRFLEDYLSKVDEDGKLKRYTPSSSQDETFEAALSSSIEGENKSRNVKKWRRYMRLNDKDGSNDQKSLDDEPSNFYLTAVLLSVNLAVFLFEIASPIRNSNLNLFSLPMVYGAKVNNLILTGEWWRLVTPMFLHSGVFDFALSCWILLTFGPQVSRAYGPFTFFLIYVLGGLSGNMISFVHTPEPTVGGTGPAFAMIGAWLIYQIQNKDLYGKDSYESLSLKATIATALGFTLSNFSPIDDWTHFGAAFTGLAYGFFTCSTVQLDDKAPESSQEEGIRLVTSSGSPCKSLVCFSIFILLWTSLVFMIDPPLNYFGVDSFE